MARQAGGLLSGLRRRERVRKESLAAVDVFVACL